ncbi:Multiple RNA-binding domain-containing protein 1 [Zalerion maritima]|uniref:Multiple RNA-binding domain-containing protein 1 n=1 Tax=Zalerion maritima TaxID=339359 RepID=A0AAD5RV19_9PEZI|nr:Multiple RNA-binding domain-containing protein 1 [Zalerion maritima]
MESSRVFVKNIPPNISEVDLRKHFSSKAEVTSLKIIPNRRIAFIGYKNPEAAAKASKFYNRTYIRLSKLSVEIASPLGSVHSSSRQASQPSIPIYSINTGGEAQNPTTDPKDPAVSKKRKRDTTEAAYVSAVLPGNDQGDENAGPPIKIQALEREESDDEYQVAKPSLDARAQHSNDLTKTENQELEILPKKMVAVDEDQEIEETLSGPGLIVAPNNVSDDEWLRSRTNRVLDFVDPDEIDIEPTATTSTTTPAALDANAADTLASTDNAVESASFTQEGTSQDKPVGTLGEKSISNPVVERIKKTSRLYVRNLAYGATETELRLKFESFGDLEEVHLCVDKAGKSKGFAFLHFSDPARAIDAFQQTDGADFQGRILHVLPSDAKRGSELDEFAISQLPLKQQNVIKQKKSSSAFRWNELFMSQDAVNASIASRKGISKADLFDHTSSDTAVKQAIAETEVIRDAKAYFVQHGVDLESFKSKDRTDGTAILVKNFPHGTTIEELRTVYEPHGEVRRVLMPPTGTIAIVEFAHPSQAKVAYMKTGYQKFKDSVLFLEKAPKSLLKTPPKKLPKDADQPSGVQSLSVTELLAAPEELEEELETASLFVKNLNFNTTSSGLEKAFGKLDGFMTAKVKTRPDPKNSGEILSMGFGFVEFKSKELAQQAIKHMDSHVLDAHKLTVRASHRGQDAVEERKKQDGADNNSMRQRKIIVKNLPFQTTKKDLRELIGTYGTLKSLRLPKNFQNRARGFAFAEFTTPREARNAYETLRSTHFLGRKLALEWAEAEAEDPEEVLSKMQQKAGSQMNKVTLQQLKGQGGRHRFDVEGDDEMEDA